MKRIVTSPHGAQELIEAVSEEQSNKNQTIGNRLFTLQQTMEHWAHLDNKRIERPSITMTGEEIESLCQQWRAYRASEAGKTWRRPGKAK